MHYWRKDYFETLTTASANALSESIAWQDYATFCSDYERGLRKQAFQVLERFLSRMQLEPFAERRRFVHWLLTLADEQPGSHMMIPYPLRVRVVEPTLLEWSLVEPLNSEPFRWIGDSESLEKAVALNATDQLAVKRLIRLLLNQVGMATHELPRGYLGSPSEDLQKIARLENLLSLLADENEQRRYAAYIAEDKHLIDEHLRSRGMNS
jgi:hypothetical protein